MATKNTKTPDTPQTIDQLKPGQFQGNTSTNEAGFKYNTTQLTYPLATGSQDYPHFVVFFINIRGKSKYKSQYQTQAVSTAGQNRGNAENLQKNINTAATVAGVVAGGKIGADIAGKVLANSGKTTTKSKIIGVGAGVVGGAILGGVGANAAANALFEPDKTYRIDSAIRLAVNERPSVNYRATYEGKDLGMLGALLAGGSSAVDSSKLDFAMGATKAMLLNVAKIPQGIVNAIGGNVDINAMASFGTGMAQNPFREQIFQNVQTRTFKFDYKFLPRSKQEADAVQLILKMFRFHMHPELASDGLFYIYPSEFDIVYYFNGKENPYVHKISTCVLEDMRVDYGGSSQFSSFEDGHPTEINLQLQFIEKEVLTKERVANGY